MVATEIYQYLLPFDNFDEPKSIKIEPHSVDEAHQQPTIEFSYWIDTGIARNGLNQHWLAHTIESEETHINEQGKQRHRVLVRAKACSESHILQQLHKYGDKAELVSPPELRERMRKEVERMYKYYQS
jgi:predicted DNA-binding transcriptional regulator YafY